MNNLKFRYFDKKLGKYIYFSLRDSFGKIPSDVSDEEIQQFTGIWDEDENEIYVGDIVETCGKCFEVKAGLVDGNRVRRNETFYSCFYLWDGKFAYPEFITHCFELKFSKKTVDKNKNI